MQLRDKLKHCVIKINFYLENNKDVVTENTNSRNGDRIQPNNFLNISQPHNYCK